MQGTPSLRVMLLFGPPLARTAWQGQQKAFLLALPPRLLSGGPTKPLLCRGLLTSLLSLSSSPSSGGGPAAAVAADEVVAMSPFAAVAARSVGLATVAHECCAPQTFEPVVLVERVRNCLGLAECGACAALGGAVARLRRVPLLARRPPPLKVAPAAPAAVAAVAIAAGAKLEPRP